MDCCTHSLGKRLRELEEAGWIGREQQPGTVGQFGHNIYTICPDDDESTQKRKQFLSPIVTLSHAVKPHAVAPHAEELQTKKRHLSKDNQQRKRTTTEGAASAASGGLPASQASRNGNGKIGPEALAKCFLDLWSQDFKTWYGVKYRVRDQDAEKVTALFEDYMDSKPRPLDLLFIARKMWVATQKFDAPQEEGKDPWFYNIRAQRNPSFFCRYFDEIVKEQGESVENVLNRITQREVDELEHLIKGGRDGE